MADDEERSPSRSVDRLTLTVVTYVELIRCEYRECRDLLLIRPTATVLRLPVYDVADRSQ